MMRIAVNMLKRGRRSPLMLPIGVSPVSFFAIQQGSAFSWPIASNRKPLQAAGAPIWGCDHLRQSIDDQKPLLDAGWECMRGIGGAISPQNALGDGSCAGWAPLQQCTTMMFEGICAASRIRDLGARSK